MFGIRIYRKIFIYHQTFQDCKNEGLFEKYSIKIYKRLYTAPTTRTNFLYMFVCDEQKAEKRFALDTSTYLGDHIFNLI